MTLIERPSDPVFKWAVFTPGATGAYVYEGERGRMRFFITRESAVAWQESRQGAAAA